MQVIDLHLHSSTVVFFKQFAIKNQLPRFYMSQTLVENGQSNLLRWFENWELYTGYTQIFESVKV